MRKFKISLITLTLFFISFSLQSQSKVLTFSYKKGQVMDIILLNTKPDTKEALNNYFKTAFPVAEKHGYNRQIGLSLAPTPTQGNFHPESMIFGYWNTHDSRKNFLAEIDDVMPNFHKARREIWSNFNLTYYELKNDLSFQVDRNKYNVVTAYWKNDASDFDKFINNWNSKAKKAGGKEVVNLKDGQSPFGYYYSPDYLVITEWESKAAFDKFYKENLKMNHKGIKHVNQFIVN